MEPLEFGDLPEEALLLVDSPPVIYILEDHPQFGPRFAPLFAAHAAGRLRFAVTTITVAEVLDDRAHLYIRGGARACQRRLHRLG